MMPKPPSGPPILDADSRDWATVPRTWRDVICCRAGQHQRITKATYNGTHVARCSCGGIELDGHGNWMNANEVGLRSKAEADERAKGLAELYEVHARVVRDLMTCDQPTKGTTMPGTTAPVQLRVKNLTIEALQWTGDNEDAMRAFVPGLLDVEPDADDDGERAKILTSKHSSWTSIYPGWWVIKGAAGQVFVRDADDFAATYEIGSDAAPEPSTLPEIFANAFNAAEAERADGPGWLALSSNSRSLKAAVNAVCEAIHDRHRDQWSELIDQVPATGEVVIPAAPIEVPKLRDPLVVAVTEESKKGSIGRSLNADLGLFRCFGSHDLGIESVNAVMVALAEGRPFADIDLSELPIDNDHYLADVAERAALPGREVRKLIVRFVIEDWRCVLGAPEIDRSGRRGQALAAMNRGIGNRLVEGARSAAV